MTVVSLVRKVYVELSRILSDLYRDKILKIIISGVVRTTYCTVTLVKTIQ